MEVEMQGGKNQTLQFMTNSIVLYALTKMMM